MADQQTKNRPAADTESIISRCGSISGDAFVSLRSRRSCPPGRTPHKIDRLAQQLKDYHTNQTDSGEPGARQEGRLNSCFHQYRFLVAMLAGLSVGVMQFHRYNMTIAVLRMVNQTHLYLEENPDKTYEDFLDEGHLPGGEFPWNNEIVATILGWYMFSYTLPQFLAAKWTTAMGCRFAMPLWLIVCTVSTLLTPHAAYLGWKWVVACRLLGGAGAAGVLPGMIKLLEDWMRYDELASGLGVAQILVAVSSAVTPLASGYLAEIHWSLTFYVAGYGTIVFCALWLVLITDEPHSNWLVSERELERLCECEASTEKSAAPSPPPAPRPAAWLDIMKLRQFYAYLLVWTIGCCSYSCYVFLLPAYMRQFLKIPISENGFYCFIIQVGFVIAIAWPQSVLGLLIRRYHLTMTQARRYMMSVCVFMMVLTWTYVGAFHQYQLPLFFLNRCFVATDLIMTGSIMSNFAKAGVSSVAFAMINTVGNISITGVSAFFGWLLDYTGSSERGWSIIFYCLAGSQIVLYLVFMAFIDSEPINFEDEPPAAAEAGAKAPAELAAEEGRRCATPDSAARLGAD